MSSRTTSWSTRRRSSTGCPPARRSACATAISSPAGPSIKDATGAVTALRCTYDPASKGGNAPDGRKVQATLHWVAAADALPAEVRLYTHLFNRPDPGADGDVLADLNPDSLEVLTGCLVEPALRDAPVGEAVQFERTGYFAPDPELPPGRPVFNRTVGLRDTWAKVQAKA